MTLLVLFARATRARIITPNFWALALEWRWRIDSTFIGCRLWVFGQRIWRLIITVRLRVLKFHVGFGFFLTSLGWQSLSSLNL
jgi:hypothetical protein